MSTAPTGPGSVRTTAAQFDNLHDATLLSVRFDWAAGAATFNFRTPAGVIELRVEDCTDLRVPKYEEWGRSVSVLSARFVEDDPSKGLEVSMQSGDRLVALGRVKQPDGAGGGVRQGLAAHGASSSDWRHVHLHGSVGISRLVGEYHIHDMRVPCTKYRIKVFERDGEFAAFPNIRFRGPGDAVDGTCGLGRSEIEALQDAVAGVGELLSQRPAWREEDLDWCDPRDF